MARCKYGDPTCPCQDGDMCHYEGDAPMNVPPEYVRAEIKRLRERVSELETLLEDAVQDIADWGAYAGGYFQEKHDLEGCLERYRSKLHEPPKE